MMLTGAGTVPRRLLSGLPVPGWFHEDTSAALQALQPRPSDIIIASWPKSGTHWLYRAVRLLTLSAADAEPPMALAEMLPAERPAEPLPPRPWNPTGLDSFAALLERESALRTRVLVSHGTPDLLPPLEAAGAGKLLYVARDPKDVVTSNYFFMGTPKDGWAGSMNRFTAPAAETPNAFGGWFEHVAAFEALAARLGPERACVIEYEAMHEDLDGCLRRLARLIGPEAEARLADEGGAIKKALGFDEMKAEAGYKTIARKGVSGDWREHFSPEDEARVAAAVAERLPVTAASVLGVGRWR